VRSMAGKRGQNEGSIFRRKDGRWCGVLNLGWEDGRRKRKHFYGDTAAEVHEQLLKARSDKSSGLPIAFERQTVAQFLDDLLEHALRARAKPRSYESFSTIVRLHIKPSLGKLQLQKLAPQQIQKLLDEKNTAGLSAQTVTSIRTVLRSALSQAVKWNLVSRNSAALVNCAANSATEHQATRSGSCAQVPGSGKRWSLRSDLRGRSDPWNATRRGPGFAVV
jgi:integrase